MASFSSSEWRDALPEEVQPYMERPKKKVAHQLEGSPCNCLKLHIKTGDIPLKLRRGNFCLLMA